MDITRAFNNVHHERLTYNMRKRKIPKQITDWTSSFLTGRSTKLRFNDVTSESIPTQAEVPQESPLSPTLYMFYNGDLLDIPQPGELGLGFIDDIAFGVQGLTDIGNAEKIQERLKDAEEWRKRHGA